MSLLGNGAMVFWHDVDTGDDDSKNRDYNERDYKDWHSNEHLIERVAIPGFLRGRRARALEGEPAYVIMYEVESVGVLSSKAYVERLSDPSPWTQRVLANYRNSNRTLCAVEQSWGLGVGTYLLTSRLAAAERREQKLRGWLDQSFLEALVEKAAIVGAHFLCADEKASRTETEEKKLRDRPDEVADWIVLVEGYDEALMRSLLRDKFDPGRLEELGAAPGSRSGLYQLEHIASHDDVHRARLAGSP